MQVPAKKTYEELLQENTALRSQLEDAADTLEAIRTGSVDALVVQGANGHELYTLQTADAGYRVFIENMSEGAVTVSEEGTILYTNAAFAAMAGGAADRVLGRHFADFVAPECSFIFDRLFHRGWDGSRKVELTIAGSTRVVPCLLSVTRLKIENGDVLSIIATDLTAQKQAEAELKDKAERLQTAVHELESSNHDLQQFASVASHDLQEPLRKISIFGGLLRNSLSDRLSAQETLALEKIITSSARLKTMVSDVLSFSRLAAHTADDEIAEPPQADLNNVVRELLEDLEVIIAEHDAVVRVEALPIVSVPVATVRQVLQNLLSNALKFSRSGVRCQVHIGSADAKLVEEAYRDPNRYALVSVSDNGIGFDEKFSEKIFGLFQRLNAKDAFEGSGIGLAVARRLTERAGGAIRMRSKEGEGTEAVLILPVQGAAT